MVSRQSVHVGDVFTTNNNGDLIITDYVNNEDVGVRFINTGFERRCKAVNVRAGKVSDPLMPRVYGVGFIGVGEFGCERVGNRHPVAYSRWHSMLERCYDGDTEKHPTYQGCTVCAEWHNYQSFAKWFSLNYPDDGKSYQLDKDLKVKGNKIYSPETCVFASHKENARAARAITFKIISPAGVEMIVEPSIDEFCKVHGLGAHSIGELRRGLKPKGHYKGWTMPVKGEYND